MHALWDIPELVQSIFTFLDNKARIGAATVCRSFWLNTLPFTWREVNDIYTLMQLFPDDSIAKGPEDDMEPFTLKRTLHESDWERFLLHSQYTKQITIFFSEYDHNHYQQLLQNSPSRTILPNLTCVHFNLLGRVEGADSRTIGLFLPNTVSLVRVCAFESESVEGSTAAVLGALAGTKLPSFSSFGIESTGFDSGGVLGSEVSQVLHAHQTIETLSIDMMGSGDNHYDILSSAGQLPKLLHLNVVDFEGRTVVEEPEILSLPHDHLFPALRTLKLSGAPDFIDTLTSRINSGDMETINLSLDTYNRFDDFEVHHAAGWPDSLLSIRRFTHLRKLVLELGISISPEALNPLLECGELETFIILAGARCPSWLPEDSLIKMGRAWRQLKTMDFSLSLDHSRNKYITLPHLQIIAREFRNLVKLTVEFDATSGGNEGFQFDAVTMADNELRELDVSWSMIDENTEKKIVPLFQAWWPKLRSVTCETESFYSRHWESVMRAVQNLTCI
ncbi:hypothetical protein FRC01_011660 [Tulasnella sp. 417]|nr:hypothetical protein FRC01_011660 [Tulasnella sp. 417]